MGSRRVDVLLALAAILSLTALGIALRPQSTPVTRAKTSAADISRPDSSSAPSRQTALVIGDAYTSGSGLAEMSYACDAVTKMGWLCKLAAEPGTGYISGGTANRFPIEQGTGKSTSFGERIPALAGMYTPDIVILDGGRYDTFAPRVDRLNVTASTIWQVHQTWPAARIIYIQPRFLTKPEDDLGVGNGLATALKLASGVKDLVVVDPILSFKGAATKTLVSPNGNNPSESGERALASALAKALASTGIQPTT